MKNTSFVLFFFFYLPVAFTVMHGNRNRGGLRRIFEIVPLQQRCTHISKNFFRNQIFAGRVGTLFALLFLKSYKTCCRIAHGQTTLKYHTLSAKKSSPDYEKKTKNKNKQTNKQTKNKPPAFKLLLSFHLGLALILGASGYETTSKQAKK